LGRRHKEHYHWNKKEKI